MTQRNRWAFALVGLALAARPVASHGAGAEKVFTLPIQQTTLDNGLNVLSIPFDSPGIIAYYTIVRTGSRNEVEKGLSGFAHFFEHMMFRGTDRYPQDKYNDVLKALGANSNAFTSDDLDVLPHDHSLVRAGEGCRDRGGPVP